jgi:5-methylcytosine-specific restriction enzyme A
VVQARSHYRHQDHLGDFHICHLGGVTRLLIIPRRMVVGLMPNLPEAHNASSTAKHHVSGEPDRRRKQLADQGEAELRRFYRRALWLKFRAWFIRHHPLCVDCEAKGILTPTTDVDHDPPLRQQLAMGMSGLDEAHCRGRCHPCHSRKTSSEDGGFGNKDVAKPSVQRTYVVA